MDNDCIVLLEVSGSTGIIYDMESECFSNQTYIEFLREPVNFWGLDFEKVIPSPPSLLSQNSLMNEMAFKWDSQVELFLNVHYPKRKSKPTVKEVLQTFSTVTGLLPSEFKKPRNLDQVMLLIRQTEVGRRYLFISHIYHRNLAKYGKQGLYRWREKNWGSAIPCKSMTRIALGCYKLETFWTSPEGVFKALSALYPELVFKVKFVKYAYQNIRWAGRRQWQNGELVEDEELDLNKFILDQYFGLETKPLQSLT